MKARSTLWKPTPGSLPSSSFQDTANSKGKEIPSPSLFYVFALPDADGMPGSGRILFLSSALVSPCPTLPSFRLPALHAALPVSAYINRLRFRPAWALRLTLLHSTSREDPHHLFPAPTSSSRAFIRASRTKLASSLLLAYHIKMQHPLLILSRLFFAVMAERHWRSHL